MLQFNILDLLNVVLSILVKSQSTEDNGLQDQSIFKCTKDCSKFNWALEKN